MTDLCPCGRPLHYSNPETEAMMRRLVADLGEYVTIEFAGFGIFRVPRHYVALHGLKAQEAPALAAAFAWERIG